MLLNMNHNLLLHQHLALILILVGVLGLLPDLPDLHRHLLPAATKTMAYNNLAQGKKLNYDNN
jgi:hypothetical protein